MRAVDVDLRTTAWACRCRRACWLPTLPLAQHPGRRLRSQSQHVCVFASGTFRRDDGRRPHGTSIGGLTFLALRSAGIAWLSKCDPRQPPDDFRAPHLHHHMTTPLKQCAAAPMHSKFRGSTCAGVHQLPQRGAQRRVCCELAIAGEVLLHRRRRRQHLFESKETAMSPHCDTDAAHTVF